ncbi:hypothetical protein BV98_001269 [Sphingobium herbicidovorans NBRC 16415]|uniref:Uncharacterized protein n=1 Tax=Sphingobium herbicidovorans (strain ATCC 700291 / DSM 11019 / CCUG 56400 / KCTC 2939 / LMG 18315 / NBRC 16415 / MH) TaxID=1219045 RepID=A0A086PBY4_SPHHM|nr:hypothetical protein BV98_001269 [Sphingobium herbicidovorans NBRC 16415]
MPKGDLDIFQSQLELIGIELFGPAAETMPHEGLGDRLEAFDLSVCFARGDVQLRQSDLRCGPLLRQHPELLQYERTERVNVVGLDRLRGHDDRKNEVQRS